MEKLIWLIIVLPVLNAGACKCPPIHVSKHIDSAVDIVVGKVIAEEELSFENYSQNPEAGTFKYTVKIKYAYRNCLRDTIVIYGGKGGGDCGAIFYPGLHYQLVVFKHADIYCSSMCADNNFLPEASATLSYLNNYFDVNYHPVSKEFAICTAFATCMLITILSLIFTHEFHQYRRAELHKRYKPVGYV